MITDSEDDEHAVELTAGHAFRELPKGSSLRDQTRERQFHLDFRAFE